MAVDKAASSCLKSGQTIFAGTSMNTLLSKPVRTVAMGLALGLALIATGCSKSASSTAALSPNDMSEGSPTAKITVVEYASVACPICARINHDVMPAFKAKYVDPGKVLYIYRPMMTGNPAVATAGHLLAQCAGKDKFFKVVDAVMSHQDEMNQGGAPEQYVNARPVLLGIAQAAGLSEDQFNTCITDAKGIHALDDANDQALKAGVDATPTFFVNGKKMDIKKGDITDFDAAIQPLLK
jgi:protein-disulfide isomerase